MPVLGRTRFEPKRRESFTLMFIDCRVRAFKFRDFQKGAMTLANLSTEKDMNADNALKYQADHLAKALWRLANDRIFWQNASARTQQNGRTVEKRVSGITKPGFIVVSVQSNLYLGFASHHLRLWRSDYANFYNSLPADDKNALETYLLKPRHSAAFHLRKRERRMYRAGDTDEVLERVLLRLTAKCERVRPADPSQREQE